MASRTEDPRSVLFADDAGDFVLDDDGSMPCGFYWTEGRAGLGWAVNGLPTLKGGSAIGIPSPPAIWFRQPCELVTPDVRDAERLQGFQADWTAVSVDGSPIRVGHRWKMVGNAMSVPVAAWLGERLRVPGTFDPAREAKWARSVWPNAAWGHHGEVRAVEISEYPRREPYQGLADFLRFPMKPLSARATSGFLRRTARGSLRFVDGFLEGVEYHLNRQRAIELRHPRSSRKARAAVA